MTSYEKEEIEKKRCYMVVKGNDMIQKTRFELSLAEQKSIAFVCSLIKPIDVKDSVRGIPYQLEYEFQITDYCKICGIDYDQGKNYNDIKNTFKKLRDRSMWMMKEDNETEVTVAWMDRVWTNKRSGKIKVRVDEDLVPFLFELKKQFTQYELYNILAMKSGYSVRLYELMKSYEFQKQKSFELDELKKIFMVENVKSYSDFSLFRARVLEISVNEINELTDLSISWEPIHKGRKVVKVHFSINKKEAFERYFSREKAEEILKVKE